MATRSGLEGSVALVTGAASGIGAETCRRLRSRSVTVVGIDAAQGIEVDVVADIRDLRRLTDVAREVIGQHGSIDILCNVAGVGAVGDILANGEAEWRRVLDVNVLGTVNACKSVIPSMRERRGGCIINVSSVVAIIGHVNRVLYAASKGAVASLTRAMAADYAQEGIRVNAVCPGPTHTPWLDRIAADTSDPEEFLEDVRRQLPLGRVGTAGEIAETIVYLASPNAAFMTGALLVVDGGISGIRFVTPS